MTDERTDPQYKLRWPADLRDKIDAAANANKRSMNAEIIDRLERSFSPLMDPVRQAVNLVTANDLLARSQEMVAALIGTIEVLLSQSAPEARHQELSELVERARKAGMGTTATPEAKAEPQPSRRSGGGGGDHKTSRRGDPLVLHNKPKRALDL